MDDGDGNVASSSAGPGSRCYVVHSPCSSVSPGSPSSRSEQATVTPVSGKKSKKLARAVGSDKSERGLRQFSMKVCQKVESKGRTTYNEVADELVAEFANSNNNIATPDQQQYEEKNIRRRVYDALNVLMAMDIISKDKKEIQWKGLPRTSLSDIEELKVERIGLRTKIEKKAAYLRELQEQCTGLENLVKRNEKQHDSGTVPSGGVALPFILIQTRPHATVEVEISEDMQLVHFDFNSTPFELHDDAYILKALRLCDGHFGGDAEGSTVEADGSGSHNQTQSNSTRAVMPCISSKPLSSSHVPALSNFSMGSVVQREEKRQLGLHR